MCAVGPWPIRSRGLGVDGCGSQKELGLLWDRQRCGTVSGCPLLRMWSSFLAGLQHRGSPASEGDGEHDELVGCRGTPGLDLDTCVQYLVQRWRALCCPHWEGLGGQTFLACKYF